MDGPAIGLLLSTDTSLVWGGGGVKGGGQWGVKG